MSLSLTKPSGWAFGEVLTSAQMEALDTSQAQAIDGVGGGTYAPSATIVINGSGLQTNALTVTGDATFNGNLTFGNSPSDTITINATPTFVNPVTLDTSLRVNEVSNFYDDVTVHVGLQLYSLGDTTLGTDAANSFQVNATAEFNAPIVSNDTLDVVGDTTIGGTLTANNDVQLGTSSSDRLDILGSLATVLMYTGNARVPLRRNTTLPLSSDTLQASDGQVFRVNPSSAIGRTYTILTDDAVDGDWMLFYTGGSTSGTMAADVTIKSETAGQSAQFNTGDTLQYALFTYDNGSWWLVAGRF